MPNTKSAKKRLRQNEARRLRNRSARTALRSQLRRVRETVKAGETDKAEEQFRELAKRLDRAGARNLIHRNTAARTKSRLQKLIRFAKGGASASSSEAGGAEST
jgi:small subunit ribosomal protein S20